ncbi:MAG: FxsA family protein [Verrucomicrobiota bacterium]
MFLRLLALFILVPLVELAIFMVLGSKIGIPTTILIVIITGFIGATLTRSQGLRTIRRYQEATGNGRLPHEEVLEGLMLLFAGAVLLTPGFLTDVIGFALLVPPFRAFLRRKLGEAIKARFIKVADPVAAQAARSRRSAPPSEITIEAEVIEDIPDPQTRKV